MFDVWQKKKQNMKLQKAVTSQKNFIFIILNAHQLKSHVTQELPWLTSSMKKHQQWNCKPFAPLSHVVFLHLCNRTALMMSCLLQQEWHKYCTAGWRRVNWNLAGVGGSCSLFSHILFGSCRYSVYAEPPAYLQCVAMILQPLPCQLFRQTNSSHSVSWSGCVKMLQGEQACLHGVLQTRVCLDKLITDNRCDKKGETWLSFPQRPTCFTYESRVWTNTIG